MNMSPQPRIDGRSHDQLRPLTITRGWSRYAEGSALIDCGNTRVLCTASWSEEVPRWMRGQGKGWVTAEYSMLPRATQSRSDRESVKGRVGGRTQEISRLIARSLRSVVNTKMLGEKTLIVDCDVLQADGGTRTAAITGAYVAMTDAFRCAQEHGWLGKEAWPLVDSLAAISVGIVGARPLLDLSYEEDVRAETDMNVVMTGDGRFVELQGTAEQTPWSAEELQQMLDLASRGISEIMTKQREVLEQ